MNKRSTAKPCAQKFRNFCFTWNNWNNYIESTDNIVKAFGDFKYLCLGFEVAASGTPHIQGYVDFPNPRAISGLKSIHPSIHWEKRLGTWEQAVNYCKKDGDFKEFGTPAVGKGKRTDLEVLRDQIYDGSTNLGLIIDTRPDIWHKYGRTLQKLEDSKLNKNYRNNTMTEGIWYYGKTGVGKTRKAYFDKDPSSYYTFKRDNGYWGGYKQQPTVIINEFREGLMALDEILLLIDRWPHDVKRKHNDTVPFTSSLVIITSPFHPKQIFTNNIKQADDISQLMRRLKVIKLTKVDDQYIETIISIEGVEINPDKEIDTFVNQHLQVL